MCDHIKHPLIIKTMETKEKITWERCEMCGKKKPSVKVGVCVDCHAETCDETVSDCPAKQEIVRRGGIQGFVYSLDI